MMALDVDAAALLVAATRDAAASRCKRVRISSNNHQQDGLVGTDSSCFCHLYHVQFHFVILLLSNL
jgi:hypothetical protein